MVHPSTFRKYHHSLQTLKPFRWSSPQSVFTNDILHLCGLVYKHFLIKSMYFGYLTPSLGKADIGLFYMSRSHPVDKAGFLSFTTFAWMTPMMWAIFRNRLDLSSLGLSQFDVADTSGERSETLFADSHYFAMIWSNKNISLYVIGQVAKTWNLLNDSWICELWKCFIPISGGKRIEFSLKSWKLLTVFTGCRDSGRKRWQRKVWKKPHWSARSFVFNEPGWFCLLLLGSLPCLQRFSDRWVTVL